MWVITSIICVDVVAGASPSFSVLVAVPSVPSSSWNWSSGVATSVREGMIRWNVAETIAVALSVDSLQSLAGN